VVLLLVVTMTFGCRGPSRKSRSPRLPLDVAAMSRQVPEGPRREAKRAEWRIEGRRFARRLFSHNPMPNGMPSRDDDMSLRGQRLLETVDKQRALERRLNPAPPAWSMGVDRPPERTHNDVPREWSISVKRGETLALLANWCRTDKKTLWQDNRAQLPRRKWLRPSDRLNMTMSPNQKLAFDQSRERFHNRRLERYFATRFIDKVVKYRVKRGDYISRVARRFGNVPTWLLEAFNQSDFRSIQPGDIVLIPVIAKVDRADQAKGQLQVTDEHGRPLKVEEKARLQNHARTKLLNRARLSMDDSNIFERANEPARPQIQAVPQDFATQWAKALPKGPGGGAEAVSEDTPRVEPSVTASGAEQGSIARRQIAVRTGETIGHYARWAGLSLRQIKSTNPAMNPDRIRIGQRLELNLDDEGWVNFVLSRAQKSKASQGSKLAEAATKAAQLLTGQAIAPMTPAKLPAVIGSAGGAGPKESAPAKTQAASASPSVASKPPLRVHLVKPGEISGRIARHYSVSVNQLTRANPDKNLDRIRPGQALRIPAQSP
jgi:LysM repeat protein